MKHKMADLDMNHRVNNSSTFSIGGPHLDSTLSEQIYLRSLGGVWRTRGEGSAAGSRLTLGRKLQEIPVYPDVLWKCAVTMVDIRRT